MLLKSRILFFLLFVASALFAQKQYGFEWIKPNQPYYKFKIVSEGAYYIDSNLLAQNGINLNGIDPRRFQLFRNGVEIPLFIHGQDDGVLNANDHIEFYAQHNDGMLDQQLYQQPLFQPHPWRSMITDTAVYFLTISDPSILSGKRFLPVADNDFSSYTAEPFFIDEEKIFPSDYYVWGPDIANYQEKYNSSEYLDGEGWSSAQIGMGTSASFALITPFKSLAPNAPDPTLEMKIIPDNNAAAPSGGINHHVKVSVGPDNVSFTEINDLKFTGYAVQQFNPVLTKAQIGNLQTVFKIDVINDLGLPSDYNTLSYIKLNYSRQYDLGNKTDIFFTLNPVIGNLKSYITFQNYGNGADTAPVFFDLTLNKRIRGVYNLHNAMALDTNDGQPHQIFVTDSTKISLINSLTPVTFPVIDPAVGYEFLMVTSPVLNLKSTATQYANFRRNRFNTLMVYSQQLYDYYTYGNVHPLAIRRLADHLLTKASTKPKFLLLAGRGYETRLMRDQINDPVKMYNANLVPSIGVPSSDMMFTNGLTGTGFEADIPTGRIPAESDDDLNNYFEKLLYYEGPDSINEWRKNILHIAGGQNSSEQQNFQSYLNSDKGIIRGKSFGANVITFKKSDTDPTSSAFKEELIQVQNSGISLLTFLGHGATTTLDVQIGSISDLYNKNKYPLFYLNGCNAGNANDVISSSAAIIYGKDYVCAKDKGVIGWIGGTNLSIDANLGSQMNTFYNQLCISNYGMPVGYLMQQTSKAQFAAAGTDLITKMHNLQWLLQGDPAVVIYSPALPDLKIASTDLFITPKNTNALSDSFAVGVIVTNLARTTDDTVEVSLTRTFPSGAKLTYPIIGYTHAYYKDTVYIWVKSKDASTFGINLFEVTVDKLNKITESNENNNFASISYFIPGTGLNNLFPQNNGIVNTDTFQLVAQNNDLSAQNVLYLFEIDTSATFSSPLYKKSEIITSGALATWKVTMPHTDTTVYFWRSSFKNPPQGIFPNGSSFTYIHNGENGWAQSKFDQYKNVSTDQNLVFDSTGNKIQFIENSQTVLTKNRRWYHGNMGNFYSSYSIDPKTGGTAPDGCELANGIVVDIFNGKTLQPMENPRYPWTCQYVINNTSLGVYYYTFNTTLQSGRDEFRRFIDSLDNGTYIAIWARYDADVRDWDNVTKSYLGKIGSQKVGAIQSFYTTFVLIGRKGWTPGMAIEDTLYNDKYSNVNPLDQDTVTVSLDMKGNWYTGFMQSEKIGPTSHWGKLFYNFKSFENAGHDYNYVDVIGMKNDGTDTILFANAANGTDLSGVNVSIYPNIRLSVTFADTVDRTPNQFGNWMVTYQPVPEGTINPVIAYDFYKDNISQGDSLKFKIAFQNLTKIAFDSLPVQVTITDANRHPVLYNWMYPPLGANASTIVSQNFSTRTLSGNNTLQLTVNGNMRTKELTLSNNVWVKNFNVLVDKTNPIMDVTFDGYRIMNGDYVSPSPLIRVSSKDDNPYIIQNDTSTFAMFLKRPGGNAYERINLNTNNIRFIAGTSQNNKAILEYTPDRLPDGIYSLQVLSKDASGNISGTNAYTIDFNVVNASMITNFFPYPNPCTTNMRFVFTLTGAKPPDDLLIRIMTISGKIVKEVSKVEFGNIHIGNNISEWAWNGNDTYGDRLANGVYLYQVLTRIDGNAISKLDTKADKYFIQNTGKIYLMH